MTGSRTRLLMFALFCAAVLVPRLGSPHLHLCLDGAAPAAYLHLSEDTGSELTDADHNDHNDQSVDLPDPVIGKLFSQDTGGLLLTTVLLVFVDQQQALLLPHPPGVADPPTPHFLRPLLRGPPA